MTLDFRRFGVVIASLRSDGRRGNERRHRPRVGGRMRLAMLSPDPSSGHLSFATAWMKDLAVEGLGLTMPLNMVKRQRFVLLLPRSDGPLVGVAYEVRTIRKAGDRLRAIGARAVPIDELHEVRGELLHDKLLVGCELMHPLQVVEVISGVGQMT